MASHTYFVALLIWGAAAGALWFARSLWPAAQAGDGLALCGSGILGLLGVRLFFKGFTAWDRRSDQRQIEALARRPSNAHGRARWATPKDVKAAGMLKPKGLFLGSLNGRDLHYPGETHWLTIAPPGSGKGTSLVVPNLLLYEGSMIVSDPKGELCAMTAKHRRERLGHEIIVLNPWREKLAVELETDLGDAGFNPLSFVQPGDGVKDDAELVAALLLPNGANQSGSDEFFNDFGQAILAAVILFLVWLGKPELVTLPELRRLLFAPPDELNGLLQDMAQCTGFGGVIQEYGGKLLATLANGPAEFSGGLASAQKALRIYDYHGPLGRHVAAGELDFTRLKRQPTTVYLILPSDRAATHAGWLNLVISLAMEAVGRDRSNRRVVFLLDECANLGYLPNILRGMALYRGQGVQVAAFIQQVAQLERLYGRAGLQEFLGMSEVISTFGVWDPETLKILSELVGQETLKDFAHTVTPEQLGNERSNFNYAASNHGRALLRPEDIRTLPADEQLIFYKNLPPIRAKKVSYLERRAWRKLAEPNPYHRHGNAH